MRPYSFSRVCIHIPISINLAQCQVPACLGKSSDELDHRGKIIATRMPIISFMITTKQKNFNDACKVSFAAVPSKIVGDDCRYKSV